MLPFGEWVEAKKIGTYGKGNQLPVLILPDGTIMNQSQAILDMICSLYGAMPKNHTEQYWFSWYRGTRNDTQFKDGFMNAFFNHNATQ